MEAIEITAIARSETPPKIWKRYVDNSLLIIHKDSLLKLHEILNSIDSTIKFTIELENNGQIVFLDTLITREDGTIKVDVYRKPTNTDRYLDFHSHYDKQHKASVASTFRAQQTKKLMK